jgi:hypothetical protein
MRTPWKHIRKLSPSFRPSSNVVWTTRSMTTDNTENHNTMEKKERKKHQLFY